MAKNSVGDLTEFRRKWIVYFRKVPAGPPAESPWEGYHAYRELAKIGIVDQLHDPDIVLDMLLSRLSKEVDQYKLFSKDIVSANRSFKSAIEAFTIAKRRLEQARIPPSMVSESLQKTVDKHTAMLEEALLAIESQKTTHWKDVLLAAPEEREKWWLFVDDQKKVQVTVPSDVTEGEKVFDGAKYPTDLVKRIDLDYRFQVRVAKILRSHLAHTCGISLRTISRLTVLTYLCGGLGRENINSDGLVVSGRKREITVTGVDQLLRDAGLK